MYFAKSLQFRQGATWSTQGKVVSPIQLNRFANEVVLYCHEIATLKSAPIDILSVYFVAIVSLKLQFWELVLQHGSSLI